MIRAGLDQQTCRQARAHLGAACAAARRKTVHCTTTRTRLMGIVIDEMVMLRVRTFPCDICGRIDRPRAAHHIKKRGFGGGTRLDIKENLLSVCMWECHDKADRLPRIEQFKLAAKREHGHGDKFEELVKLALRPKI